MLEPTNKAAHSVDVAIPNSHNLHSAITEQLQKYTESKRSAYRYAATENVLHNTTSATRNWYYPKQIAQKSKTA